jgi:hypothetical protein
MQSLRRLVLTASFLSAVACIILLLNFTAPNPTGRRYSSEMPLMGRNYSAQTIGSSGEAVLSKDLELQNNNHPLQRKCICNSRYQNLALPNECNSCIVYSDQITNYRIPDFIGTNFIAESKNRQQMLYSYTDQVYQITDYVTAAKALNQPLWLYTRVDTKMSPEFNALVETTGGKVVPYFTVPNYVDPVDYNARVGIAISLLIFLLALLLPFGIRRIHWRSEPKPPKDPLHEAIRKSNDLKDFKDRATQRARTRIDIEDSRHD